MVETSRIPTQRTRTPLSWAMACVVCLVLLAATGFAATGPSSASAEHLRVSLTSENSTITGGQVFWLGVQFQLEPGWHVYWINPGDSGEPPHVKWTLPAGFQAGALRWPRPERISAASVTDYGYSGAVLLMAPI